jgi:Mn-dependent DtxR family transcriptional regulator
MNYTAKQGQYLAFIYHYSLLNRRAPAEFDIQKYFRLSAPTVHQMIVTLDRAEPDKRSGRAPGQRGARIETT